MILQYDRFSQTSIYLMKLALYFELLRGLALKYIKFKGIWSYQTFFWLRARRRTESEDRFLRRNEFSLCKVGIVGKPFPHSTLKTAVKIFCGLSCRFLNYDVLRLLNKTYAQYPVVNTLGKAKAWIVFMIRQA